MKRGLAFSAIAIVSAVISLIVLFASQAVNSKPITHLGSDLSQQVLNLPNANLTDEQLIRKGFDVREVKLLYTKYPDDVYVDVDRMYLTGSPVHEIWATYGVQKSIVSENGTSGLAELKLQVSFDQKTNQTKGVGAYCQQSTGWQPINTSSIASVTIENEMCFK